MSGALSSRAEIGATSTVKSAADRMHAVSRSVTCDAVGISFIRNAMSRNAMSAFVRTSTFRLALTIVSTFLLGTLLLSAFVYWQSAVYLISQTDALLAEQMRVFVSNTPEQRLAEIDDRLLKDPNHTKVAALFSADGQRIAGNMDGLVPGLVPDVPTNATVTRLDGRSREAQEVRVVAHSLPNGQVLVIGQNIDAIPEIAGIVRRALLLGLLPGFGLAVAIGIVIRARAHNRLSEVNGRIQRIVAGDLRQRLPTNGSSDAFDQLALSVNYMLDEIEARLHEIAGAGENIAHDLRTPLTRVRIRLERGRAHASTLEESRAVTAQAIDGLDQSLTTITALLRIAAIEHSRRIDGFGEVRLAPLLRDVGDIYEPIAENKRVSLQVEAVDEVIVHGDRDLLFEATANLVDNAVKFTPEGGRVALVLLHREGESIVRISDNGPGIPEIEREAVTRRFYRSDKSRKVDGLGLGLSLVAAIVKLHGFHLNIAAGPGCTAEIICSEMS
jgi:signal transduction histidine kinase